MKQRYLIDSRIFMDHLCGQTKATAWLIKLKDGEAVITPRARAEILITSDKKHQEKIQLMLDQYPCIPFDKMCSDKAHTLWKEKGWSLDDAFHVALAHEKQLIFVTNKHKGFRNSKDKHVFILKS